MNRTCLAVSAALSALALAAPGCAKNETAAVAAADPAAVEPAAEPAASDEPSTDPDGPASIAVPAGLAYSSDAEVLKKGEQTFATKGCTACHRMDATKLVGPGLQGVTKRRTIGWLARMILKPDLMVKQDAAAKELFKQYMTPMANQAVNPETELPALLAYLKSKEG